MHNKLVEIPYSEWPELRELYVNKKVEASGYYALQILGDWAKRSPEIGIKIYSLNGQWREDGTFIAIMQLFSNVFCNTLAPDLTSLKLALSVLDSKPFYRFFGFSERILPAIKEFFTNCGLSEQDFNPDGTAWYHITKEKAREFVIDPPDDVQIGPIDSSFYLKINSVWPHRSPGSEMFVKNLLSLNDSVGAYDEQGDLIAWCLRLPIGSMGLLQVDETYKRRGLGSLLVRCMSQKLADTDQEILAPVVFKNVPSRIMFEKLGFTVMDNVYWVTKKRLY